MCDGCCTSEAARENFDKVTGKLTPFVTRVIDVAFRLYQDRPLSAYTGAEPYTWADAIDSAIDVVMAEEVLND